jgi:opacity protein-like surface antigen
MKQHLFFVTATLIPTMASAAIPYRVEQVNMPNIEQPAGIDNEALARTRRFYVGGAYNFAMWDGFTNSDDVTVSARNSNSFEAMAGVRIYDTFRLEANYIKTKAHWKNLSLTGDTVFVNAILDARVDNIYRLFHSQMLVPYVGVGAGLSWNSGEENVHIDKKIAPVAAAMAGIGIEFNTVFALDFGYRYFYMFNPKITEVRDLNPTSHQFRLGARVSF